MVMPSFRRRAVSSEAIVHLADNDGGFRRMCGAASLRRRDVILGLAAAATLGTHKSFGQGGQETWAAVVIGVDHAGNLPVLRAASSGAKDMAKWLIGQGYAVRLFTDETAPVRAGDIFDTIQTILDHGIFTRLVIYFAGHGFINQQSEFWLLSGAPQNPNEAVNLAGSAWRARFWTIHNVVFISDACRSRASDLGTANISGSVIFPNFSRPPLVTADIDQFFATQIGDTASEAALTDSVHEFHGIYTESFLSAFSNPPSTIVEMIDGQQVVPDRGLQRYLLTEVPRRAQSLSLTLRQYPDAIVTSPDKAYLGRISGTPQSASASAPVLTTKDLAAQAFGSASQATDLRLDPTLAVIGQDSGYFTTHDIVINSAISHEDFPGRTGFTVSNTGVRRVAITPGGKIEVLAPTLVRVETGDATGTSVLIEFEDGSGTVAAVLPDFVATIVVEKDGIVGINYSPSRESWRFSEDKSTQQRLSQLRANAAAAARLGVFRVDTPNQAESLADTIRVLKGIDPTLGLYAAYAYEQASRLDQVNSVAEIMREDLSELLFDVAMLAGLKPVGTVARAGFIVPFCPMLSQGWNYLDATSSVIPEAALRAASHLRQALWTTFEPEGVAILLASSLFPSNAE
jgi:Caspase domain